MTSATVVSERSHMGKHFALKYVAIAALCFTVYAFPFELFGAKEDWLTGYLVAYAKLAGGLLGLVEHGITVTGTVINGRYPLQIVRNCDAAEVNILFGSAVLAYSAPLSKRLVILGVGLVTLVLANVTRICCLYFIGVYAPSFFKVAHEEVWPLILVAFTALLFLRCVRAMEGSTNHRALAAAS